MIYRFTEVLNDLVNYFLLGDILLLEDWKQANHLSDDLAMEFTTNESGDRVFDEGIVIPMAGIENYPYTILFNLSGDRPELCKERNRLQLRKSGYSLKVDHNMARRIARTSPATLITMLWSISVQSNIIPISSRMKPICSSHLMKTIIRLMAPPRCGQLRETTTELPLRFIKSWLMSCHPFESPAPADRFPQGRPSSVLPV